jgi:hypothetical protein
VAPTSGTSPWGLYINNSSTNLCAAGCNVLDALVTKSRMTWGDSGDHSTPGPAIGRSEAFYTLVLSSGQIASLYSSETTFVGSLTTGYVGPGDNAIVGNETSYSTGLTSNKVLQLQWLSQAFSLRKAYAGYEGPALNACQQNHFANTTLFSPSTTRFGRGGAQQAAWSSFASHGLRINLADRADANVAAEEPRISRWGRGRRGRSESGGVPWSS